MISASEAPPMALWYLMVLTFPQMLLSLINTTPATSTVSTATVNRPLLDSLFPLALRASGFWFLLAMISASEAPPMALWCLAVRRVLFLVTSSCEPSCSCACRHRPVDTARVALHHEGGLALAIDEVEDLQGKRIKHQITVEPRYNEVLGTMKITLYIRFLIISGKKTKKYKELGPAKLPCYKRFCYIRPLYNEVPL